MELREKLVIQAKIRIIEGNLEDFIKLELKYLKNTE